MKTTAMINTEPYLQEPSLVEREPDGQREVYQDVAKGQETLLTPSIKAFSLRFSRNHVFFSVYLRHQLFVFYAWHGDRGGYRVFFTHSIA